MVLTPNKSVVHVRYDSEKEYQPLAHFLTPSAQQDDCPNEP